MRWPLWCLLLVACGQAAAPAPAVVEPPVIVAQPAGYVVPPEPLVPTQAIDLIVAFEVGSPEVYQAKYRHPVLPPGESGITFGIGYDARFRPPSVILTDWEREPHKARLATASGVTGPIASELVREMADISIEYGYAREVFDQTMVVEHYRLARRAFGPDQFDRAPGPVRGALLSVVFNRGSGMTGRTRQQMRNIRDICLPAENWTCVEAEIRGMIAVWKGTPIERGMARRRNAEADLIGGGV